MNPLFIDIKDFRAKMEELRRKGMDFLRDIIGMDWGEEGLGAIYTLENTTTKETCEVAVRCTNRETPT
ncbi:MAG: NADH-quinone oxidoreductase subunit C, partial [Bacteroidaceae bacterium]|nr:NADH-quinone oxidoreductase subunit C [Bacteroidaceae bacterium]